MMWPMTVGESFLTLWVVFMLYTVVKSIIHQRKLDKLRSYNLKGDDIPLVIYMEVLKHVKWNMDRLDGCWVVCQMMDKPSLVSGFLENRTIYIPSTEGTGVHITAIRIDQKSKTIELMETEKVFVPFEPEKEYYFIEKPEVDIRAYWYNIRQNQWVKYDTEKHASRVWKFLLYRCEYGPEPHYVLVSTDGLIAEDHRELKRKFKEWEKYASYNETQMYVVGAGDIRGGRIKCWESYYLQVKTPNGWKPTLSKMLEG